MFEAGKHWRSMAQLRPGMHPPQEVCTSCLAHLWQSLHSTGSVAEGYRLVEAPRHVRMDYMVQYDVGLSCCCNQQLLQRHTRFVQESLPVEVAGAWLVQRAATLETTPEALPAAAPAGASVSAAVAGTVQENSSIESLTDQSVVPAPGEKVRYKQSELMRLTARRLASAAAAGQAQLAGTNTAGTARIEEIGGPGPSLIHMSSLFSSTLASVPTQPPVASADWGETDPLLVPARGTSCTGPAAVGAVDAGINDVLLGTQHALPDAEIAQRAPVEAASSSGGMGTQVDVTGPAGVVLSDRSLPEQHDVQCSSYQPVEAGQADEISDREAKDPSEQPLVVLGSPGHDSMGEAPDECSGVNGSATLKIADGTVLHKRRSSRTVPGLLQTIAEVEQEEST